MANMFGDLYIGNSGIQGANNAINVVANNLSNVNTNGYVRQQVLFSDTSYNKYGITPTATMEYGLGVRIADVVHARDIFLDKSYRSESGRAAFYNTSYEVVKEVEDILQEGEGEAFSESINDLWEAFQEYAKDPANTVNQNLVVQRAQLFMSRSYAAYEALESYQNTINAQIRDDINRINELGNIIHQCNLNIQKIEAGGIETAMEQRDVRDAAVDELAKLANIDVSEDAVGIYYVKIENVDFVDMGKVYPIAMKENYRTGYVDPYWPQLSDLPNEKYKDVFNTYNISAERRNEVGEVKALLLARGEGSANYLDLRGINSDQYDKGIGNSVLTNTEAEIDTLLHSMVTAINDMFCPNKTFDGAAPITATDATGKSYTIEPGKTLICDTEACRQGSDGKIPPLELFTRIGVDRYTEVTDTNGNTYYLFNEEDYNDPSKCYILTSTRVNEGLIANESLLAHINKDGSVAYKWAEDIAALWSSNMKDYMTGENITLNPSDLTPCNFNDFYTKLIGELGNNGTVFRSTGETLDNTVESIEYQRQQIVGVSSDEELSNMIQYQSAYNAASRYINVVSQMIEHIITTLGA